MAIVLFSYEVLGKGYFPADMLRHDSAWPMDNTAIDHIFLRPEDTEPVKGFYEKLRRVRLQSCSDPTDKRWESFGWTVMAVHKNGRKIR